MELSVEQISKDLRFKKESAIWGKYKTTEGENRGWFSKLYLHIPKGKDTFEILYKGGRFDDFS